MLILSLPPRNDEKPTQKRARSEAEAERKYNEAEAKLAGLLAGWLAVWLALISYGVVSARLRFLYGSFIYSFNLENTAQV